VEETRVMEEARDVLEENLTCIVALSDVLWVASLTPEHLQPMVITKMSQIIQDLAEKSLESLDGLLPQQIQKDETLIPARPVACR
jgi:hypothetical protein